MDYQYSHQDYFGNVFCYLIYFPYLRNNFCICYGDGPFSYGTVFLCPLLPPSNEHFLEIFYGDPLSYSCLYWFNAQDSLNIHSFIFFNERLLSTFYVPCPELQVNHIVHLMCCPQDAYSLPEGRDDKEVIIMKTVQVPCLKKSWAQWEHSTWAPNPD